jgi:hypothetical protein
MEKRLTHRQNLFINYYLEHLNASKAARLAGYTRASNVTGSELLHHPVISWEIEQRLQKHVLTKPEILDRLSRMAETSITDIVSVNNEGQLYLDTKKLSDPTNLLGIKKLVIRGKTVTITMMDTGRLLFLVAKLSGYLNPQDGTDNSKSSLTLGDLMLNIMKSKKGERDSERSQ